MNRTTAFPSRDEALYKHQRWHLPGPLQRHFAEELEDWRAGRKIRRLWQNDASLWTGGDEENWLGWLTIPEEQLGDLDGLQRCAAEIQTLGFEHILLLGIGESSLAAKVLGLTFGKAPLQPQLVVLDSTDTAQILRVAAMVDFRKTLFIAASKSGTALEPNILREFFYEEAKKAVGPDLVGSRFIAITDPGSALHKVAEEQRFRHVFFSSPNMVSQFSAVSNFGMVPAALAGVDVGTFLVRTLAMVHSCGPRGVLEENPGVMLGLLLGVAANHGRDKITLVTSTGIATLGAWVEQLLAQSIGKSGKGFTALLAEELGRPSVYGRDRLFCYLREEDSADLVQDEKMDAIEASGQPVVRIDFCDSYDLGQEFFRWEFAAAIAGAVLGINPFVEPDVEAIKLATCKLMAHYEANGALPEQKPLAEDGGLKLFADDHNAAVLIRLAYGQRSVSSLLNAHLERLLPGDYFALLSFIDPDEQDKANFEAIRTRVRDRFGVATSIAFAPRYFYSASQAYKAGPNKGVFLQVTHDHSVDLPVPGHPYTFGVLAAAQAQGEFNLLAERHRRALWVHVGADVRHGLATLCEQVSYALK